MNIHFTQLGITINLQFFSSSVTYPAMGMGPLMLECHSINQSIISGNKPIHEKQEKREKHKHTVSIKIYTPTDKKHIYPAYTMCTVNFFLFTDGSRNLF